MSTTTSAPVPVIKPCNKQQPKQEVTETDNPKQCEINKNMKSEKDRLLTYVDWPNPGIDPKELAKAGFYSIRYEDAVRCAFCQVEICRWEEGDNAMSDHQRWSNTCPFIRGNEVGNIPLEPNERVELPRLSQDTCGRYGIEIRPYSVPERSEQQPISLNKLGITPNKSPSFPQYATKESRINTFKEWPLSIKQKPDELAEAGFFYIGKGDQTMCFLCGGGLKDWLEGDDPWEQHARWFPKCSFVLMVKGREFVSEVSNRLPAMLTSQQGADLKCEAGASKTHTSNNKSAASTATAATASPSEKPSTATAAVTAAAAAETSTKREKVDDGRLCKICYMEELGVVFLPCGHIVACVKCAPSLSTCAVCRQPFSATVRAFLS